VALGGLGFLVGSAADRIADRFAPRRSARPEALEAAWRAFETNDPAEARRRLAALDADTLGTEALVAEHAVLRGLLAEDRDAIARLADAYRTRPAGAVALLWLIDRASDEDVRATLVARFRARYPRSWVLATRRFGGGA
jgi:hypothetical protein